MATYESGRKGSTAKERDRGVCYPNSSHYFWFEPFVPTSFVFKFAPHLSLKNTPPFQKQICR